ncbi:hypothetical protein OHB04_02540 [Streptomyces sp. NBC_01775]|uniref:hypothetical protein n=1 Tax=Streptomyces sp. NBC_01775 TaxID=2975939 RepID=UPI002DD8712D|nr:hypothetical protein [Streptomyces sp. NBC_01775]WSB74772.1 hypothetical protein OHB04_02540 [Streptomyces sp. NBC_01775]
MYDDLDIRTACVSCGRGLWDHEIGHYGCSICVRRVDENLADLAGPRGMYAQLSYVMAPGRSGEGGRVSGSKTAPIPVRLAPLSLQARGGVVTVLQTWLIDWHEQLGYTHPRWAGGLQQQCDQTVQRLRNLLPWAAENHVAFDEFVREVGQLAGACKAQVSGETPPRRVTVACVCGAHLRITLDTPGRRCGCGQQYGWAELRQLPLAERAAA